MPVVARRALYNENLVFIRSDSLRTSLKFNLTNLLRTCGSCGIPKREFCISRTGHGQPFPTVKKCNVIGSLKPSAHAGIGVEYPWLIT